MDKRNIAPSTLRLEFLWNPKVKAWDLMVLTAGKPATHTRIETSCPLDTIGVRCVVNAVRREMEAWLDGDAR